MGFSTRFWLQTLFVSTSFAFAAKHSCGHFAPSFWSSEETTVDIYGPRQYFNDLQPLGCVVFFV